MTRFARASHVQQKKPLDASKWTELKPIEQDLKNTKNKEQRREHRRIKRIKKKVEEKVCFNCRETGHSLQDCPKAQTDHESGSGICFKCGSTEHSINSCKSKLPSGEFPYAKCFICGEMGHLSKQCPDNPRGLYPMGGCCRICQSVEHYQKDCPEKLLEEGIEDQKLLTWNSTERTSVDAELSLVATKPSLKVKKGPKIVKF